MIIGLIGLKRSGKDTFADYIVNKYNYEKYSFAGPLKKACQIMFCLSDEQVNGELKEDIDPRFGLSPREILQFMGTEIMRESFPKISENYTVKESFWIYRFKIWYEKSNIRNLVISDVRFQDEVEMIKNMGGIVIKINNPKLNNVAVDVHKSENVDDLPYDYVIQNGGTFEEYYENIKKLVGKLS